MSPFRKRWFRKYFPRKTTKSTQITVYPPTHYEPLDPALREIRILDVAPGVGDAMVECTMRRISLRHEFIPIYETISYCWGSPRPPSTIKLNGHLTSVPTSSEAAIRRMRLRDRPRTLWIDAICIDQSSVTERSEQVAFMSTVFRGGMRNLIYLGEDDGMAERGVQAVQDVVTDMRTATNDLTMLAQTIFNETGAPVYSNEEFSKDIDFEALEALFSLYWFRRLWVVQEVVLATSNTCHWGTLKFDLLETVRAASWLAYKRDFMSRGLSTCAGWISALEMFDLLDRDNGRFANYRCLASMLDTAHRFEKTEIRDSIYAILGLIDQDEALGDDVALLEVDYTKSIPDVLRDATRYALSERNDLEILHRIHHRVDMLAESSTFPTWTFRADLLLQPQDAYVLPILYCPNKGLEAPSMLSDIHLNENVLLLQGIAADQVVKTTVTYDNDLDYYQWLISAKDMVKCHGNIAMQENIDLDMTYTLVVGQTRSGEKAQPDDLQELAEYIKGLANREDGVDSDGVNIRPHFDEEKLARLLRYQKMIYCRDRRFFITAAGRLGLGPRCMQPEDIVVILRGGDMPFILREKADGYWFIGAAYVHGIMHGEAVESDRSRGGSEVVFHVR